MSDVATADDASELAQAGTSLTSVSPARVGFSIRHVADQPGVLMRMLRSGDVDDVDEMLASGAYGSGYILSLRRTEQQRSFARDRAVNANIDTAASEGVHFVGGGNPNPAFLYDDADPIDFLVVVDPDRVRLTRSDGLVLASVIAEVSDRVVGHRAPFLSIQSPVLLPRVSHSSAERSQRTERWRRPSGFGIRFAAALGKSAHLDRLRFFDSVCRYCADRGLGLWLGDRRPGYRSGNWFRIMQHSPAVYREHAGSFRLDGPSVGLVLPFTAIGPARVGTTNAIVSVLRAARVPILSTTVLAAQDMSFIHLGIAISDVRRDMDAARAAPTIGPISTIVSALCDRAGDPDAPIAELLDRSPASDYTGLLGGVVTPRFATSKADGVIWAEWEVPAYPSAGMSSIVSLVESLSDVLGLHAADDVAAALPSIEYLTVRRSRGDRVRCRAKLSVNRDAVIGTDEPRRTVEDFCDDAEDRFRDKLAEKDVSRTSVASVAWRESWLGRWAASSWAMSTWR